MSVSGRFDNCYDSHVHWLGTGQIESCLSLNHLKNPEDIRNIEHKEHHFFGDWLFGFGWDQTTWDNQSYPHRRLLDEVFPDFPVRFLRIDGHASWVNTKALIASGIIDENGRLLLDKKDIVDGEIKFDHEGPTGILIDGAQEIVKKACPSPTPMQIKNFLLKACKQFNSAGFTHIRDLSCTQAQWQAALELEGAGLLTLAVEQFFGAEEHNHFDTALDLALRARKDRSELLRPKGVKVYLDGALGSEGAWISQPYRQGGGRGHQLLTEDQLKHFISQAWSHGLEIAVHAIGDEAAHLAISVAARLWDSGLEGRLNLEHAELLRPDTIELMKQRNVHCFMQPCHWWTDKIWLEKKLGSLARFAFPWKGLQLSGIPFSFGSDSPVEKPSIARNLSAVEDASRNGIAPPFGTLKEYHEHTDKRWAPNTYTLFEGGKVVEVLFKGKHLI